MMKKLIILIIGFLISFAVFADNNQLYQIDLIVFSHVTDAAVQSENWSNVLKIPFLKHAIELQQASISEPDLSDPAAAIMPTTPFQFKPDAQLGLQNEAQKLENDSHYQLILHLGWQQPISDFKSAKWIHIYGGQAYNADGNPITVDNTTVSNNDSTDNTQSVVSATQTDTLNNSTDDTQSVVSATPTDIINTPAPKYWQINGKIRLSQAQYFTINTNLYLTMPESILGNGSGFSTVGDFQTIPLISFAINETRRTSLNQLNYLDHPLFGVLIKITKIVPGTSTAT